MKCVSAFIGAIVLSVALASQSLAEIAPERVGKCVDTRIRNLGSRLQGVPSSGSAVTYVNGVWAMSYEVLPEIQSSRVGDPIRLCLVFVPRRCPKGDDRGKIYSSFNLRTFRGWFLPNDEHACGGA